MSNNELKRPDDPVSDREKVLEMARVLYEGTQGISLKEVAELTGIPAVTLRKKAHAEDWAKSIEVKQSGATTQAAIAAREFFEHRKQVVTSDQESVADAVKIITDRTPVERDEMLKRHRAEWAVPRTLAAEATRLRDVDPVRAAERARLGKTIAETLRIVQDGERKAHGIDVGEVPEGHVVVIERAQE